MSLETVVLEGIEGRSRRAFGRSAGGVAGGRPVIVKAISSIKRRSGAVALVRYVARLGEDQKDPIDGGEIRDGDVSVHDESGGDVARGSVLDALSEWSLSSDRENATKGDVRRPRNVQVHHLILSATCATRSDREILRQAAAATVQETFGSAGHRCLWAMHEEHGGHPHVYVVVRALSDVTRRRIRFDRRGELLDGLRAVLARNVRALGNEHGDASRRADREELIEAIRDRSGHQGDAPGPSPILAPPPGRRRTWRLPLEEAAPDWWRRNGQAAMARQGDRLRRKREARAAMRERGARGMPAIDPEPPPIILRGFEPDRTIATSRGIFDRLLGGRGRPGKPAGSPAADLISRMGALGAFRTPERDGTDEAIRGFLALRDEAESARKGLAEWTLKKRPWLFGPVSSAWRRIQSDPGIQEALKALPPADRTRPAAGGGQRKAETESAAQLIEIARVERERSILVRSLAGLAVAIERRFPGERRRLGEAADLRERAYDVASAPVGAIRSALADMKRASSGVAGGRRADTAEGGGAAPGIRKAPEAGPSDRESRGGGPKAPRRPRRDDRER